MFVGRNWRAKGEEAEILKQVVQFVKARIGLRPKLVARCKRFRRECRQPEQVIAAIHHHVDSQIVTRVNLESGRTSSRSASRFHSSSRLSEECLMPVNCGICINSRDNFQRVNLSKGNEHFTKFKGKQLLTISGNRLVAVDQLLLRHCLKAEH